MVEASSPRSVSSDPTLTEHIDFISVFDSSILHVDCWRRWEGEFVGKRPDQPVYLEPRGAREIEYAWRAVRGPDGEA